jgi:ATP-binding cassette subfamily B protein
VSVEATVGALGRRARPPRDTQEIDGRAGAQPDRAAEASHEAGASLGRVLGYLRPYWRSWLLILLGIGVSAVGGLVAPLITREIVDHALPSRDLRALVLGVAAIVAASLVVRLSNVGRLALTVRVGQAVLFDLRNQLYAHLHRQPMRFFTTARTGELMARLSDDVAGVESAVSSTPSSIAVNVLTFTVTLAVMLMLHWPLALMALAILPIFIVPTLRVSRISREPRRETAATPDCTASSIGRST